MDTVTKPATSCASKLRVLADETRLAVLEQLFSGPMQVGEINEKLSIEQSLLSHHLKVLRGAGLVTAQREGRYVRYTISKDVLIDSQQRSIDLGCCCLSFPRRCRAKA